MAAKGLELTGIHNVGEFYSNHYLSVVLESDLAGTLKRWAEAEKAGGPKTPAKKLAALANKFFTWQGEAAGHRDVEPRLDAARELHAHLLEALGYARRPGVEEIGEGVLVPVVTTEELHRRPYLWVLEAPFAAADDDADPLSESPHQTQLPESVRAQSDAKLATESWRELLDGKLLRRDDAPRWVLFLAGTDVFLIDRDKWPQGRYLHFALGELMGRREAAAMQAMSALLHREVLMPEGGQSLLDTLDENSHKHAFAVSTDLKYGAQRAIELIGNEAVRYIREVRKEKIFGDDALARKLTRESLLYLYRLLFLFYVEARGVEMEDEKGRAVVPMKSDAYRLGYSLETLRELELVPLTSVQAREGFYLDTSLRRLFRLIFEGHGYGQRELDYDGGAATDFEISGLRSPLFDEDRTPILKSVKLRNEVVQQVVQLLSLSKGDRRKGRGRISYATLGINQLGAVYEGLLSYTGFFAQEDLYEIRAASELNDPDARTYFVPAGKIDDYHDNEKVRDDRGKPVVHPKGTYLFRLAGRDREKSASYYTPEVLTRCLTKYTLKERLGEKGQSNYVPADEILKLTVCEPAMGSGAFLNEAVNQLADAYLERKQDELGRTIPPERYAAERQRVKYHIAVHNCYGVDLNPLAAELGKVSLWLNILQPGVEAPYVDQRIAVGNSLIGARREVFDGADLMKSAKGESWLEQVPRRVPLGQPRPKGSVYHFLVPDSGMAPFDGDKVVQELEPEAVKRIKAWRAAICRPYTKEEVAKLVALSDRIDVLWDEHVVMRQRVLESTRQAYPVWPATEDPNAKPARVPGVEECEEKAKELEKGFAPGRRLKAVMDYWCALWFWPILEAKALPDRATWMADVEALLDADVDRVTESIVRAAIARETCRRERPFHWEVQFADVMVASGGFDVIIGNPPWLKVEWREAGILGDFDPRVQLRKMSAKQVADARKTMLGGAGARTLFSLEFCGSEGAQAFLNSKQAYALLRGVQTNLYKCFLVQGWRLSRRVAAVGLFHQAGLLDDPKGGPLRRELSKRLAMAVRFPNSLQLFEEVGTQRFYAFTVSRGSVSSSPRFQCVSNVLHPAVLDRCFEHDGVGQAPGLRNVDTDSWDLRGHRSRVVEVDETALALFAKLYDPPGTPPLQARLPVVHSQEILDVLRKFADAPRKLGDIEGQYYATEHFHETNQQKDGTIKRETRFPKDVSEWVVSGPHFYVATPFNKTPNEGCSTHLDYAVIDLTQIPDDYLPRTNYVPACSPAEYRKRTPHWNGRPITEFYRHVHREMVAPTGERTLVPAILPPGPAHVNTLFAVAFDNVKSLASYSAMCSSIVVDFFVKTTGMGHVNRTLAEQLPIVLDSGEIGYLHSRVARLNSLSAFYSRLWNELFDERWKSDGHAKDDHRLRPWSKLTKKWTRASALRTPYERRQALVELDALAALSLGLTADELCLIYKIQFPVMQQYERETYYDQRGMIVFTTNRGLSGVGLDRKQWEQVKDAQTRKDLPPFAADYVPPFDRCDREADMRQAYAVFAARV